MARKQAGPKSKRKTASRKTPHDPSLLESVRTYRHSAKRKNVPPAGLASQGTLKEAPKIKYEYNPHLPPVLRFDATGASDALPELLKEALRRPLTAEEAALLADALRVREPWLEWSGKREKKGFEVDPVALHIHERISAQAILNMAARQPIQPSLFADPKLAYRQEIQFYQYDVDWANRMILGDSLQVMASLVHREGMAGKVQMIYMDPPYGIKFASNFQPEIGRRDVKDKESDLTREPEMVKAYRDTWTLGVHSYLAYLRDRLMLARELLADSGSIFVQISDENLHRVRLLMDEVFGTANFVSVIQFKKTAYQETDFLPNVCDFLLWYAKMKDELKPNRVYRERPTEMIGGFTWIQAADGSVLRASEDPAEDPSRSLRFQSSNLTSQGASEEGSKTFSFNGEVYDPGPSKHWKTNQVGRSILGMAERLLAVGKTLTFKRYVSDFPVTTFSNMWEDTVQSTFAAQKMYVVQTNPKVIERCMLMTTKPGDLVLDPTCGSGTTAYVAEQWGRRWITIDTSRVALALARQRLLTAVYPMWEVKRKGDPSTSLRSAQDATPPSTSLRSAQDAGGGVNGNSNGENPGNGFIYEQVPHVTLKSIAQNVALDAIFAKHQPVLDAKLDALNGALRNVTTELRKRLVQKLAEKEKRDGKKAITDADRRRWVLPKDAWKEWQVPFDTDEEWPEELKAALTEYRAAWRAKMDEVNAAIAANAEMEDLVDKPRQVKGVTRVSGPFTMEAVMPLEESLGVESPIKGAPEEMETFGEGAGDQEGDEGGDGRGDRPVARTGDQEVANAEAHVDRMVRLLRGDGVRFPNNKVLKFARLERFAGGEFLHAEGEWGSEDGKTHRVAVSFGPEYGPVTAYQAENALRLANRRGFDDLVLAGFSFDAEAQAIGEEEGGGKVRCHAALIRPDVNMGDLLKETANSQIFTVFGNPRTQLFKNGDGEYYIVMQGVDIYNPVDNTILPTSAEKVAAWFVDSDYDGKTFCVTQAFFPDKSAWDKLARALKGVIDEEEFAAFSGTVSLPFPAGEHKRAAVKVIDPRGNEVMRVHRLDSRVVY